MLPDPVSRLTKLVRRLADENESEALTAFYLMRAEIDFNSHDLHGITVTADGALQAIYDALKCPIENTLKPYEDEISKLRKEVSKLRADKKKLQVSLKKTRAILRKIQKNEMRRKKKKAPPPKPTVGNNLPATQ